MTLTVDGLPWIDPQSPEFRQPQERWSVQSALFQFFASSCSNVPKSEMLQGSDVSQWQGEMDWNKFFDNGMRYAIIRAMINGRADTEFDRNAQILVDQKRWFGVYGATGYPTLSNAIPYAKALADLVRGMPYLFIWWDSEAKGELSPSQMARYNSEVLGELSVQLPEAILEIYTRQTFWDSSVLAGNWDKYPLAAARYNEQLTCPWSDGRFKFRDWDDWRYWQLTQCWDGATYGAKSRCIDGDLFNGNEEMFKEVYGINETQPPPPGGNEVWKFQVITNELNYRSEPIVSSATWKGTFKKGQIVEAIKTVNPSYNDFWLQFKLNNNTYYCALTYRGTQYCRQVE